MAKNLAENIEKGVKQQGIVPKNYRVERIYVGSNTNHNWNPKSNEEPDYSLLFMKKPNSGIYNALFINQEGYELIELEDIDQSIFHEKRAINDTRIKG